MRSWPPALHRLSDAYDFWNVLVKVHNIVLYSEQQTIEQLLTFN